MEGIEMKTMMRLLIMLALTVLLTGMAQAGTINDTILKKVKTTSVSSATSVRGLETYYGEAFPTSSIRGYRTGDSIGRILNRDEITLRNGRSYRTNDIEYAFVSAKKPSISSDSGSKAPHEKAPHEQN